MDLKSNLMRIIVILLFSYASKEVLTQTSNNEFLEKLIADKKAELGLIEAVETPTVEGTVSDTTFYPIYINPANSSKGIKVIKGKKLDLNHQKNYLSFEILPNLNMFCPQVNNKDPNEFILLQYYAGYLKYLMKNDEEFKGMRGKEKAETLLGYLGHENLIKKARLLTQGKPEEELLFEIGGKYYFSVELAEVLISAKEKHTNIIPILNLYMPTEYSNLTIVYPLKRVNYIYLSCGFINKEIRQMEWVNDVFFGNLGLKKVDLSKNIVEMLSKINEPDIYYMIGKNHFVTLNQRTLEYFRKTLEEKESPFAFKTPIGTLIDSLKAQHIKRDTYIEEKVKFTKPLLSIIYSNYKFSSEEVKNNTLELYARIRYYKNDFPDSLVLETRDLGGYLDLLDGIHRGSKPKTEISLFTGKMYLFPVKSKDPGHITEEKVGLLKGTLFEYDIEGNIIGVNEDNIKQYYNNRRRNQKLKEEIELQKQEEAEKSEFRKALDNY